MATQVHEASDEDMYRLFEICSLAFAHNEPFFDACWPLHWTEAGRKQGGERFKEINNTDPNNTFLKAVDSTGNIIGMAKWNVYTGTIPDFEKQDRERKDYWDDPLENQYVKELQDGFVQERRAAIVRNKGHVVSLDILAIDPSSQRQGAGGSLVGWGLKKADEMGVNTVVESSVFGKGLYVKNGFVFKKDVELEVSERFADRPKSRFAWLERPKRA
ncbi:uncharacterized protein LTR77_002593 [Saxophila tyrrhenica]|uniref:N-acetyltransferase domain-containing protein n=1 Tax=Saxophila tyrrhenica TaxID=1690608 RepID=A0AAV9PJC7_9PEZI|nr:hypothetical protein LTR77_002593 [Saxophila tyrrhenica]